MKLYHGSTLEIRTPKILTTEKGRDFGEAFYTTPIKEQAERWAKRRALIEKRLGNNDVKAVVNVYEYEESNGNNLNILAFKEASEQWLDMVINCRSNFHYTHQYDIIRGKIADDSVGETVSFVIQGIMRKEDALQKLKFQKINEQIAFCSIKALETIKFISSYEVKND